MGETKEIIWFLASLYFWNPLRYGFLGHSRLLGWKAHCWSGGEEEEIAPRQGSWERTQVIWRFFYICELWTIKHDNLWNPKHQTLNSKEQLAHGILFSTVFHQFHYCQGTRRSRTDVWPWWPSSVLGLIGCFQVDVTGSFDIQQLTSPIV